MMTLRGETALVTGAAGAIGAAISMAMAGDVLARFGRIDIYAAKSGGLTAGTAYSVSKTALIGLTCSIAGEVAGEGVTSNAVAPAYMMSPMVSEQRSEAQFAAISVGRFGEPEEVAHAVMFPASPLAGFITSEIIDLNGGLHFD